MNFELFSENCVWLMAKETQISAGYLIISVKSRTFSYLLLTFQCQLQGPCEEVTVSVGFDLFST